MKYCPKCLKIYDDRWGVCLECDAPLEHLKDESGLKDIEQKKIEREKRGIKLCSFCHNEFPSEMLSKPKSNKSLLWGFIGVFYAMFDKYATEKDLACPECNKKSYDMRNKIKYAFYLFPLIVLFLFWLALFLTQ